MTNISELEKNIQDMADQCGIEINEFKNIMNEMAMMIKSRLEYLEIPITLHSVGICIVPCLEARQKMIDDILNDPEKMKETQNRVIDLLYAEKESK